MNEPGFSPGGQTAQPADSEHSESAAVDLAVSASHPVVPDADGLRNARMFVRDTVQTWSLEPSTANAAMDVAHELVSNAVQHAEPPIELTLLYQSSGILVTVSDGSLLPARRLPYRSGVSERGLGLRLVAQLSTEWAQNPTQEGKSVWASIQTGPRTGRRH